MGTLQVGQYISDAPNSIPAGTIVMYLSSTVPKGWLLCDGSEYAAQAFQALYTAIGTRYGSTNAALFRVPNLSARVPRGTLPQLNPGATGGVTAVTLSAAESGFPLHTHSTIDSYATTSSAVNSGGNYSDYNPQDVTKSTTNDSSTNVSATSAHDNMMPYYVLAYIIKAI